MHFSKLRSLALAGIAGSLVFASSLDGQTPPNSSERNPYGLRFEQVENAGFSRSLTGGRDLVLLTDPERISGGVAAGDYDLDGDIDLYITGRAIEPNHLYQNQGDGTFVEVGEDLGVGVRHWGGGPAWGDIDGDGDLDLFVGGIESSPFYLFENRLEEEDGKFVDITDESGLTINSPHTISALFFDYDLDGNVDLFLTHWGTYYSSGLDTETLYRNNGDKTFTSVSLETGIADWLVEGDRDWSYTPGLADIDGDGDADLLMASDFGQSQTFVNNGDGTFTRTTDRRVIKDQFGMGSALGDYDNDGDMDWFVTSIYDLDYPNGRNFGNRLYLNDGLGQFTDVTTAAGVDNGEWGWGACAADFDHDGHLDLIHVNGWTVFEGKPYVEDPVRYFRNRAENPIAFVEIAREIGVRNKGQGRGIACFDADRDGDLDVVIVNNSDDHIVYFRNDTSNDHNYLSIRLRGAGQNRFGVGARVSITTDEGNQLRDLGGGSNFVSHNPMEVHFGLGLSTVVDVEVRWPDGSTTVQENVVANQLLTIDSPMASPRLVVVQGIGGGEFDPGDEVEIQAQPAKENYYFSHWTSSGGGSFADKYSSDTTFTMPGTTVTVSAHYLPGVGPDANVSIARRWSEVLLQSIRNDYARPTIHARNLFHVSAAMYDVWTAYGNLETAWLLGREQAGYSCSWETAESEIAEDPETIAKNREEAISFAAYRLIRHRFPKSPRVGQILKDANALMGFLGYDSKNDSTDWESRDPAALGNYVAACYTDLGQNDGANEASDYSNVSYHPVNPPLLPELPGNPNIVDLNRWQPLRLQEFIDQAGNPSTEEPEFLSPELGIVWPFALSGSDLTIHRRDSYNYWVYHDPGGPPLIDGLLSDSYKWGFSLVAVWSAHLDPRDEVMIDISPASLGNIEQYPNSLEYDTYDRFYDLLYGGDASKGYELNPIAGEPYEPQIVPRGDYARVLAEFWADGPDSETPPGHWFVLLNEVNDHPLLERRMEGTGPELGMLEWDVKSYFALGGAMHDAAITAWGIKGWYDYIRPISAIRAMADRGQSSNFLLPSYDVNGIPLIAGYIELVGENDVLVGEDQENLNKIKLRAWKGPDYISDPDQDEAGVDWILAENWWPYQRPTFVTPPFAGFVSGHSTYSRSAAEVLTALTGSAYFPGGMSQFEIEANEFLVFENGPSVDMTLQWATYYDAADQCSLSRIWGGIHPPADDIPGRLIGIDIGKDAFALALRHFTGNVENE
ncbi:MAG: FG-GAP-like repeat-containing protein [Gammaproteobacteria bacterium]|nr:FG-GAP-like repeat-containing protein [Gammaproteobacteria bacterium]